MVTHLGWDHDRGRLVSAVERAIIIADPFLEDSLINTCLKCYLHISIYSSE